MSLKLALVLFVLAGILGTAFGYFLRWIISLGRHGSMELEIKKMMLEAREEAEQITNDASGRAEAIIEEKTESLRAKEEKLGATESRLAKKEELLDTRQIDLDAEEERLRERARELDTLEEHSRALQETQRAELERIGEYSRDEARTELIARLERESNEDIAVRIRKLESAGMERIETRAKELLATAIHRLGNAVPSDIMATSVPIPSDDIKGKVIGREGRNIRAFERAAGVDVIIDETPGIISLSSFDPVRRHTARIALERLIADGRIQPAKIEEAIAQAREDITRTMRERGEQAAYETGVYDLDPRLLALLGRLHFRTSYGQNVLQHSVEMAHIAGMLAEELGADADIARAGALLHDIGKAVDHEVAGTHVDIGRRILQKFGIDERIIQAMQSHHEEYPYMNIEAVIVQVADAISGGRPGARHDSIENYIKRLADLEAIALAFEGIERAFAIQAGREVRVFVRPEDVTDLAARSLARDIALRVQQELKYPGEIKINVIRESRIIEFAR